MSATFNISGAPIELLDIPQLLAMHNLMYKFDPFILDTFFPNRAAFAAKEVPIADLKTVSPLAPFVAPLLKGQPIQDQAVANAQFVKPAYLKPSQTITPASAYDTALINMLRANGVIATGAGRISDADALLIDQIQKFNSNRESIDNRKILMAIECLITGKMVFASDTFPVYTVDYGRDAACTFTPANAWNAGGATVVEDIEAMMQISVDKGGVLPSLILTTGKVFNAMYNDAGFKARFVTPQAGISVPITPAFTRTNGAQYRGMIDGLQVWTYDAVYQDATGSKRYIPADYFGMISDTNGTVAQCAIQHLDVFGQPLEYYDYIVESKDPSSITLLCDSSPLVAPSNKNGVVGGTGFVTL